MNTTDPNAPVTPEMIHRMFSLEPQVEHTVVVLERLRDIYTDLFKRAVNANGLALSGPAAFVMAVEKVQDAIDAEKARLA